VVNAVKALLYHVNEASWRHSIRELLQRYFMRVGSQVDERLLTLARELDRHYITSRYPNALPSGTPHEVYDEEVSNRVIRAAEELIGFVRREVGV
jgi:HEPN domain-containing protein